MPTWYDAFTAAIASGDQHYLSCEECGDSMLPPRRICPSCGSIEVSRTPLSGRGTIQSYTEISVSTPKFHDETPYTIVLVELNDGVSLTGQLRGSTADDIDIGDEVFLGSEESDEAPGIITFNPGDA